MKGNSISVKSILVCFSPNQKKPLVAWEKSFRPLPQIRSRADRGREGGRARFHVGTEDEKKRAIPSRASPLSFPPLQGLESVRNRLFTLTSLFRPGAPSFLPPHILPAHTHHPRRGSCEKCIPNPTPRPTLTPDSAFAAPLIGESLSELLDLRR